VNVHAYSIIVVLGLGIVTEFDEACAKECLYNNRRLALESRRSRDEEFIRRDEETIYNHGFMTNGNCEGKALYHD
jgi:hypothetical protein